MDLWVDTKYEGLKERTSIIDLTAGGVGQGMRKDVRQPPVPLEENRTKKRIRPSGLTHFNYTSRKTQNGGGEGPVALGGQERSVDKREREKS